MVLVSVDVREKEKERKKRKEKSVHLITMHLFAYPTAPALAAEFAVEFATRFKPHWTSTISLSHFFPTAPLLSPPPMSACTLTTTVATTGTHRRPQLHAHTT